MQKFGCEFSAPLVVRVCRITLQKNPDSYKYVSHVSRTMVPVEPAVQVFKPQHTDCLWDSGLKPSGGNQ